MEKGRETRRKEKMREALDNMDGQDDVIRQTAGLFLGDDYKEVKDHVVSLYGCFFTLLLIVSSDPSECLSGSRLP